MSAAPSSRRLDWVVPALAAATVVAFAAGSSSVGAVKEAATDARWVVLAALALAAAGAARRNRLPSPPLLAAAGFAGLALVSTAWSVSPRLTAERGATLAVLLAAALLLSTVPAAERVLAGLLAGATAVALLGAIVLALSYRTAVVPASIESPPRYRGFGENPNTVPLLLAVALPLALHAARNARRPLARGGAVAAGVLFAASIVGSGSRGALLAAAAGVAATLALSVRGRRLALALAAVLAATVGAAALESLPRESSAPPHAAPAPAPNPADVERAYPLADDVGRPLPGGGEPEVRRSLLGASGRSAAWRGALGTVLDRPLLGYGFGTEAKAFVDRYYGFVGGLPENSYIGIALQLGAVGLAALLGLLGLLAARGLRAPPRAGRRAACAGVVAAGLAAALVQSYLYSVGNIASATFWIAAFLLGGPEDGE